MIKQLRQSNNQQLIHIDEEIEDYHNSISSFNIIEDPNFRNPSASTISLSELNENLSQLHSQLDSLNELWVLKGLINEIESCLQMATELESTDEYTGGLDSNDLESLFNNFHKLQTKLGVLNPNLLIKLELNNKFNDLINETWQELQKLFKKFLPKANEFHSIINDIEFSNFLAIIDQFNTISEKINLNALINNYKLIWEQDLVKISSTRHLNSELEFESVDSSVDIIFESILNFINFINSLGISSLKWFYQLKLSNKLINAISENIDSLVKPNGGGDNLILLEIIKVLNDTDWNLSIGLTLTNVNEKLNEIHSNWLMDNYIGKIRNKFRETDLTKLQLIEIKWEIDKKRLNNIEERISLMEQKIKNAMSDEREVPVEPKTGEKDEWNDGWNDWDDENPEPQPEPKIEKPAEPENPDGWNENEWNEEDEDDGWNWDSSNKETNRDVLTGQQSATREPSSSNPVHFAAGSETETTTIKISPLTNELIEVINEFQIDSIQQIDFLVSTILSLSSISYPPITKSFLQYNDLQYLYKNLQHPKFHGNSELLIKQLKQHIKQELSQILLGIKLKEDSNNFHIFESVSKWYKTIFQTELKFTNFIKFKEIIHFTIDFINNWLIELIVSNNDITEFMSNKIINLIDNFEIIYTTNLKLIKETEQPESLNKLLNYKFLVNSHLVDIIERFYQGEFYNLSTDELIHIIRLCFVKSDLRDNYINEIVEFRNIQ